MNLHTALTAQNIECFSELAFACGTPNKAPTDEEFRAFSDAVLGNGATQGHQSLLRRLHFGAATFVLSQLKTAVHGDPRDGSKKLPFAEKQARYATFRERVPGFILQGETEPSHSLIYKCQMMYDSNTILWLAPSVCTKRELEVQAATKDAKQVLKIEERIRG